MPTDASNVLSDLITLSKTADQIISDSNFCNDHVDQWFTIIKETAFAIANGTYCGKSTENSSFSKDDLPSLVTYIKGKQNSHRLSTLLAVQNRVHLSHRKSRKSLRKIVLGRKSGNQWKISNRRSSSKRESIIEIEDKSPNPHQDEDLSLTPKIKDKLLESEFRTPHDVSKNKSVHSKSYFEEGQSSVIKTPQIDINTPAQQYKEILVPNTDETTPAIRPKLNFEVGATEVIKGKTNIQFSSQNDLQSQPTTPINCNTFSKKYNKATSQLAKNTTVSKVSSGSEEFLTPENNTIIIDSDSSADKTNYKPPLTRSKRKSTAQHTQENAKKYKVSAASISKVSTSKSSKWDDNYVGSKVFKQIKSKEINSVIPAKAFHQQNVQTPSEKRILKEIQKKEEKVTQNAKKLRSLQQMKIEENKKAREKKMEKAMQQRMKIEKEKEERIRSRTQSKQENLQQMEPAPKKGAHKKAEPASVIKKSEHKGEPPKKPLRSPIKKVRISPAEQKSPKSSKVNKTYLHDPSPKEITNTKLLNALNGTYVCSPDEVPNCSTPPKPIRNAKKPNETSNEKIAEAIKKPFPGSMSKGKVCLSSTPASKKIESKTSTKTPVSKKPNSYAMTPHQSSFVSYDISEIKSDSDDDEEVNQKPIPAWATGINLRTALLQQHYAPIDVDELFGNTFEPPVLSAIMGMEKKHYYKRTSSAIWLDSPNRSQTYT